ncbi:DEKNAAC104480 [Brettanomyces naardenensis]|uniref:DEKNAAC104480 n=1 Tax=Brettanomyces naardenensis TaxID=13370 RepID=A0A448YRI7_BRENA|nr:DEKNAAC104480 [Brettanomyces naardenensis]
MAQQVDTLKYTIRYDDLSVKTVYHLSIFMLPNVAFDPYYTALIYYQFQVNSAGEGGNPLFSTEFKLLGGLSTQKQSAIFKINPGSFGADNGKVLQQTQTMSEGDIDMGSEMEDVNQQQRTASIILGISVEPNSTAIPILEQQRNLATNSQSLVPSRANTPAPGASDALAASKDLTQSQVLEFSNKIIGNAYNFLSSFANSSGMVSMSKFNDWWNKFKSRMASDPAYLRKLCESEN